MGGENYDNIKKLLDTNLPIVLYPVKSENKSSPKKSFQISTGEIKKAYKMKKAVVVIVQN